jgi:hypothetical protein
MRRSRYTKECLITYLSCGELDALSRSIPLLRSCRVVALSNGPDGSFLVAGNIADLDNRRCVLRENGQLDEEAVIEQECRIRVEEVLECCN